MSRKCFFLGCVAANGRVCARKVPGKELFGDGAAGNVQRELAVGLPKGRVKQQRAVLPAMPRV